MLLKSEVKTIYRCDNGHDFNQANKGSSLLKPSQPSNILHIAYVQNSYFEVRPKLNKTKLLKDY